MNSIFTKKIISKRKNLGFTLIEALVSLSIFSASVAVLVNVTGTGVANVGFVKNKLIASYLAQEGIELIRNTRDNEGLSSLFGNAWLNFTNKINSCIKTSGNNESCEIDPVSMLIRSCDSGACSKLRYYNNGLYAYSSTGEYTLTNFIRTIQVKQNQNDIIVTSKVEWKQGQVDKVVEFSEVLTNWIDIGVEI